MIFKNKFPTETEHVSQITNQIKQLEARKKKNAYDCFSDLKQNLVSESKRNPRALRY